MEYLIDKSALVAKIKEIKNTEYNGNSISDDVACCALDMVIDAINTFEVEKVNLEDEVDKILEANDWDYDEMDFYDFAKHFFELGLKTQKKVKYEIHYI